MDSLHLNPGGDLGDLGRLGFGKEHLLRVLCGCWPAMPEKFGLKTAGVCRRWTNVSVKWPLGVGVVFQNQRYWAPSRSSRMWRCPSHA